MMKISTRTALADEKPAIWHLYESALKHHIEAIWGWDEAWQRAHFNEAFSVASTYVVEVDGRFSGYVQLDLGAADNYLRMLVLAPEWRSAGIGAKLLAEILRISRGAGRILSLRVFRTNLAAKRFYEREGWFAAAADGDFFLMRHETSLAAAPFNASPAPIEQRFEMCMAL